MGLSAGPEGAPVDTWWLNQLWFSPRWCRLKCVFVFIEGWWPLELIWTLTRPLPAETFLYSVLRISILYVTFQSAFVSCHVLTSEGQSLCRRLTLLTFNYALKEISIQKKNLSTIFVWHWMSVFLPKIFYNVRFCT